MIDWFYSKVTVTVVVFILIVFFMGFFKWQTNSIAVSELQNIADEISSRINELTAIDGETKQIITFDQYGEGVKLPAMIKNNQYSINITENLVFGDWEGAKVASPLTHPISNISRVSLIHMWEPQETEFSRTELNNTDNAQMYLKIDSGDDFVIERKLIQVSGYLECHTFIYMVSPP